MRIEDTFDVIYTHTEGEPLCIIHSGIPYPPGSSILEKRSFLEANYDWVRKALMREPRGHADMFGVFLTPPSSPEFDAGLIYIDGTEYSTCVGTAPLPSPWPWSRAVSCHEIRPASPPSVSKPRPVSSLPK